MIVVRDLKNIIINILFLYCCCFRSSNGIFRRRRCRQLLYMQLHLRCCSSATYRTTQFLSAKEICVECTSFMSSSSFFKSNQPTTEDIQINNLNDVYVHTFHFTFYLMYEYIFEKLTEDDKSNKKNKFELELETKTLSSTPYQISQKMNIN